jgi:hypothetical protein
MCRLVCPHVIDGISFQNDGGFISSWAGPEVDYDVYAHFLGPFDKIVQIIQSLRINIIWRSNGEDAGIGCVDQIRPQSPKILNILARNRFGAAAFR